MPLEAVLGRRAGRSRRFFVDPHAGITGTDHESAGLLPGRGVVAVLCGPGTHEDADQQEARKQDDGRDCSNERSHDPSFARSRNAKQGYLPATMDGTIPTREGDPPW